MKIKSLPIAMLLFILLIQPAPAQAGETSYPPDLVSDIPWSAGKASIADVQAAFNAARSAENTQLGTHLPALVFPSQSAWNALSDSEKVLWLINRERADRGVHPLHGVEANVASVADTYAQYLLDNNLFSHGADGRSPWQRLEANPAIGACHDFLGVAENLFAGWTSGSSIALPVETAVYLWMYEDAGSGWGHRHAILWYPYSDNSGSAGMEGFLGIGRAGGPYMNANYGEVIVMNIFDPCPSWAYPSAMDPSLYLPMVFTRQ